MDTLYNPFLSFAGVSSNSGKTNPQSLKRRNQNNSGSADFLCALPVCDAVDFLRIRAVDGPGIADLVQLGLMALALGRKLRNILAAGAQLLHGYGHTDLTQEALMGLDACCSPWP